MVGGATRFFNLLLFLGMVVVPLTHATPTVRESRALLTSVGDDDGQPFEQQVSDCLFDEVCNVCWHVATPPTTESELECLDICLIDVESGCFSNTYFVAFAGTFLCVAVQADRRRSTS